MTGKPEGWEKPWVNDARGTNRSRPNAVDRGLAPRTVSAGVVGTARPAARAASTHEVNIIGDYWGRRGERSFWAGASDQRKLEVARAPSSQLEWYPDSQDFVRIAKQGQRPKAELTWAATTNELLSKLAKLGKDAPGSVSRLNVFSHGSDEGQIVMRGSVVANNVTWSKQEIEESAFDGALYDAAMSGNVVLGLQGSKRKYSIDDARSAFAQEAEIVLYSCHSGTDREYLNQMSQLFGVRVKGFSQSVVYGLHPGPSGKVTATVGLSGVSGQVSDFHNLDSMSIAP